MPSSVTVRCLATCSDEEGVPLFVGRADGTVEKYVSIRDAELGIPSTVLYGHCKAVTAIMTKSAAELYTTSLDGTLQQWMLEETAVVGKERGRVARTVSLNIAIHCIAQDGAGVLYLGCADGSLAVLDGGRRSSWPGHEGPLRCIAMIPNGAAVTGGQDTTVLVWDLASGRPVRALCGHQGAIAALSVVFVTPGTPLVTDQGTVAAADDETYCLISFAADQTMRVWLLPDPQAADAEAEAAQEALQHELNAQKRGVAVSFQEPKSDSPPSGTEDDGERGEAVAGGGEGEVVEGSAVRADGSPRGTHRNSGPLEMAKDRGEEPAATTGDGEAEMPTSSVLLSGSLDPKEQFRQQQISSVHCKPALKPPERHNAPQQREIGMVELPRVPYSVYSPTHEDGDEDEMAGSSGFLFVGAADGFIYAVRSRTLVKEVLLFCARNASKLNAETRKSQQLLKQGSRVYIKAAAKAVEKETKKLVRVARKAHKAVLAEKKEQRRREREEARTARRAAAQARREEMSENSDEEMEGDEEEYEEEEEEEEEEAENEGYEGEEDAEDSAKSRMAASLALLNDSQRQELQSFTEVQEKQRDELVAALKKSVEDHLAQLKPLSQTGYLRSRNQFDNLSYTTYSCIRGGSAVRTLVMAPHKQNNVVYAAQENTVTPIAIKFGVAAF